MRRERIRSARDLADHVTIPCLAYALIEKPRPGKFHPERARSLGFQRVRYGQSCSTVQPLSFLDGRTVRPEEVMGPPRPGRKIVYTGDTRPSESLVGFAKNADLLIHDAIFDDELWERALQDGHSTPSQAAEIAKKAKVKRLVLIHISARYKDPSPLLEQARKIFPRVDVAEDFMRINLPLLDT